MADEAIVTVKAVGDEIWTFGQPDVEAIDWLTAETKAATVSCFRVEHDDDGICFRWGNDPLEYYWQTKAQAADLIEKLQVLLKNNSQETKCQSAAHE